MRVIKPYFEILTPFSAGGIEELQRIEKAARTCYKSEDKIDNKGESAKKLVAALIKSGHEAMLEHSQLSVKFVVDRGISHELVRHRLFSFAQESSRYCVAEDTLIHTRRRKIPIKELYKEVQKSPNGSYKRRIIKQVNEDTGEVIFSKFKNIYFNGVQKVFEIKTDLGYTLQCTSEHEIYTPDGYKKLKDLSVGDKVYVNGTQRNPDALYYDYDWLYYQSITLNKTFVQIANEFNYNINTVKKWAYQLGIPKKGTGYFQIGRIPWNKGLKESDDARVKKQGDALRKYHCNGRHDNEFILLKPDTVNYQKHNKGYCEICGSTVTEDIKVHHKDFNRDNNNPDNLISVCSSCHLRIHNHSLTVIHADTITSITEIGEKEVYDIEMNSNYHNFVANGIVVHNCSYNKDKFGNEITFIEPIFYRATEEHFTDAALIDRYEEWTEACQDAEKSYFRLLRMGASAQEARNVLPNSTKTEIVVTGNYREWRNFFKLRVDKAAHPQMREVTIPLLEELKSKIPIIFDDIVYESR